MSIYFIFKKCLVFTIGILVISNSFAESYVFGGRAHFQGVLINQGCSILVEKNMPIHVKTPTLPVHVNFSLCPVGIYDNLTISLSELDRPLKRVFYFDAKNQNVIYLNNELNIPSLDFIDSNKEFIRHIDLPSHYDSFSKNTMGIFLNQGNPNASTQASNILISVFYP